MISDILQDEKESKGSTELFSYSVLREHKRTERNLFKHITGTLGAKGNLKILRGLLSFKAGALSAC